MIRFCFLILLMGLSTRFIFAQTDEIWLDTGFEGNDTTLSHATVSNEEIMEFIDTSKFPKGNIPAGGAILSIFHETVDSAAIRLMIDGVSQEVEYSREGFFIMPGIQANKLIDITVVHPDYHNFDTSFVPVTQQPIAMRISLTPKYKILLRGRVFAGNVPIAGAEVDVTYREKTYHLKTLDCYYDEEDFWNCLYHGMFKISITAEDPQDSVFFTIRSSGMRPMEYGMRISEYQGDIMEFSLRYQSKLPQIPVNDISLKLSFPFMSVQNDWFVDLSYFRLLNAEALRRFAIGLNVNMFITTVSVEHDVLQGLSQGRYDSSYVSVTLGPAVQFWIFPPERRNFGTYAGCAFNWHTGSTEFSIQPYLGTRFFLDLNKAVSLEIRYATLNESIVHYDFNYYGNAYSYRVDEKLEKLHVNLGLQIVF